MSKRLLNPRPTLTVCSFCGDPIKESEALLVVRLDSGRNVEVLNPALQFVVYDAYHPWARLGCAEVCHRTEKCCSLAIIGYLTEIDKLIEEGFEVPPPAPRRHVGP